MNLVFTLIDPRDFSKAKALGESLDVEFKIVVVGKKCQQPVADILFIEDLVDLSVYADDYTTEELIAAVKPLVFKYFFENGYQKLLYIQPHARAKQSLNGIFESMKGMFLVAQEHIPEAFNDEKQILNQGMFSRHVIGMANYGLVKDIILWWAAKMPNKAYKRPIDGLFLDGIWLNHAPVFFDNVMIDRSLSMIDGLWRKIERPVLSHFEKVKIHQYKLDTEALGNSPQKVPAKWQKALAKPFDLMADFIDSSLLKLADQLYN